jgi:hypothetical protein
MAKLHVYMNGAFRAVPLAVTDALAASQASRAVRSAFVSFRDANGWRFYRNGRRIAVPAC